MPKAAVKNRGAVRQRLDRYAGEWVAFVNDRVVEHSRRLNALMKKVEAKGLKKRTSVFLVPRKGEGPYVLAVFR